MVPFFSARLLTCKWKAALHPAAWLSAGENPQEKTI
jgi:hypothetical protein